MAPTPGLVAHHQAFRDLGLLGTGHSPAICAVLNERIFAGACARGPPGPARLAVLENVQLELPALPRHQPPRKGSLWLPGMYVCQCCQATLPPRTPAHRLPIARRHRRYPSRPKANRVLRNGREIFIPDPGGEGHEIVRERLVCPDCMRRIEITQ